MAMNRHILCLGVVLVGILLTGGCTTTPALDIAVRVREPDKWNEERAFTVINEKDASVRKKIMAWSSQESLVDKNYSTLSLLKRGNIPREKYHEMNSEPLITPEGFLRLDVTYTKDMLTRVFKKERVPLSVISRVEVKKKRIHIWPWYWTIVPLPFPPVWDEYALTVYGNEKERPLVSWGAVLLQDSPFDSLWGVFPFWLVRPLRCVNIPEQRAEVQELVEAFEWLRLNNK